MRKLILVILILLLFNISVVDAATYYVDFDAGNDTSAGTSTGTAWKTLPGTKNTGDTAYVTTSYGGGTISTTNKVPAGTIFVMKLGTTHDSTDGGRIYMSSGGGEFYNDYTSASPVTFTVDESWGTGQVIIDGTGFPTALPNIYIRVDGIKWDGINTYNIKIQDAPRQGILYYHHADNSTTDDAVVKYVEFYNNGTECTTVSECLGPGQLQVRHSDNVTIANVKLDGNNNHIMGIALGETNQRVINATVTNVMAYNHTGNDPPNDTGIGFECENSQVTFTNVTSYNNLKGMDCGQAGSTEYTITYKVINSSFYNNGYSGISMNNKAGNFDETTYPVKYYIINNIIRDNGKYGIEHYAGPYLTYIVHNVIDNNGGSGSDQCMGNIRIGPAANGQDDETVKVYLYNNNFYKPAKGSNICEFFHDSDGAVFPGIGTDFSLYSDYNSWRQSGTETQFSIFAFSKDGGLGDNASTYTYADVGNTGSNWYLKYSNTTEPEPPLFGIGHYHADANSVTTEPPFTSVVTNDYILTSTYPGMNISGQGWYIPEMGTDRNGITRTTWDIGAYEYSGGCVTPSKVTFTTEPGGGQEDTNWPTQPVATVQDASNNTCTDATDLITLTIGTNPSGGTLICNDTTVNAVAGIATFSGCQIDNLGTGYTLTASATGLTSDTSASFDITCLPSKVIFSTQPGGGTGGVDWAQQPVVTVQNSSSQTCTNATNSILLQPGGGEGTGNLSCTANPINAVSGVATFSGCDVDQAAINYSLLAISGGLTSATSSNFNITVGPATHIEFTTQPGGSPASPYWATQPVVTVRDAGHNTITSASNAVTLAIGSNPGGGTLSCLTNPLNASSGNATFSECYINVNGTGYTLTAAASGLTGDTCSPFNIFDIISRSQIGRPTNLRTQVSRSQVSR